jgi:asparagine synthase (glutamine-hydrolysing)
MKRFACLSIFIFALLFNQIAFSQIEIRKPFMVDSINNKGEKFNINNLLQEHMNNQENHSSKLWQLYVFQKWYKNQ